MGIDFFAGDFEHLFDVQIDSGTAKGYFSMWALANIVGNRKDISDASGDALMMGFGESPTAVRIASLVAIQGGSEIIDTFFPYNKGQRYYQTPKRVGTTFTNKIYSDSDRTILIDTLSLALSSAVSFRYHYAGMSLKDEIASTNISGNAGNYDFQLPAGIILPRRGLGRGLMRGLGRGL
ncbi:hypothetical protein KAR91_42925 [Candidatus Pacearchaeota archaeon]|nr:hypothetical protein [Candidatus Pacearchaeota archaeon]